MNTKTQNQLNRFIEQIYKTPLDPSEWQNLLPAISNQVGGHVSSNLDQNKLSGKANILHQSYGFNLQDEYDYSQYYGPRSVYFQNMMQYKLSNVFVDQMILDYDSYVRSETYVDFHMKRYDAPHAIGLIIEETQHYINYIAIRRSHKHGMFSNDDIALSKALLPHLTQANKITRALDFNQNLVSSFEQTFNQLLVGVALVNTNMEAAYHNEAAEKIFKRADGLTLNHQKLVAHNADETTKLNSAIAKTFKLTDGLSLDAQNVCLINKTGQLHGYQLFVMPLAESVSPMPYHDKLVLVMIHDPNNHQVDCEQVISTLYKLSLAEARIAQGFCNNLSTSEIAALYQISENGVRFHTKNIFQKLHLKRQSEVVKLIMSGPAAVLFNIPS